MMASIPGDEPARRRRHLPDAPVMWPLFVGGFLGPFGASLPTSMLPELAADLGSSVAGVSLSLTTYLACFAGCMLFSGTIAERVGRRRTVLIGYLAYAVASVLCALAPNLVVLLGARAVQGVANAFTTPVLVAAISSMVPPARLGRALGLFASVQALGMALAPLIGGLAAAVHWSWAFWGSAVVAAVLATRPPTDGPPARPGVKRWRSLVNGQLAAACTVAALAYLTSIGITVLGTLHAHDAFGLGPSGRGLAVATFGVAGLLAGRVLGGALDRYGRLRFGAAAHWVMALAALGLALAPTLTLFVAAIALAGAAGTGTRSTAQSLAVTSTPDNRAGATSIMLACQFGAAALGPVVWVPAYSAAPGATLLVLWVPATLAGLLLAGAMVFRAGAGRSRQ